MLRKFPAPTPLFAMFAALTAAGLLTACADHPQDYHKGRVPVSVTTGAEKNSPQLLPAAMDEAATQITQQFGQDLMQFPPVRDNPGRITVVMGDINNKTNIVSSDDFEYLGSAIRNHLLQSAFLRNKIMFVENRARLEALAAREGVAGAAPQISRANTFTLNGNFYLVHRNDGDHEVNQYSIEFQLVNFATGEIFPVGTQYVVKQWR